MYLDSTLARVVVVVFTSLESRFALSRAAAKDTRRAQRSAICDLRRLYSDTVQATGVPCRRFIAAYW